MKTGLGWLGIQVNRRSFLERSLAATFGVLAGLSIGKAGVVMADKCTAPNGGGQCYPDNCWGYGCVNGQYANCSFYTGTWWPNACWSCSGGTCCDCACQNHYGSYYCWCFA